MKNNFKNIKFIASGIVFLFVIVLIIYGTNSSSNFSQILSLSSSHPPTPFFSPVASTSATLNPSQQSLSGCTSINGLPDINCTPGVIDPRVTQNNIYQTICVSGYTKTVRPSVSYTNQLKLEQIQQYGYKDTNPSNYEEDHLISLEIGGNPTDPKNLWPEFGKSPNPKDSIENMCHTKVCSGQITLAEAQKEISTNWPTACQK